MELFCYVFLPALAGGLIQGVTGFGAGVIMMMFLPFEFSIIQSAGLSCAISIILSSIMVYRYRKNVNIRKIIIPAVLYLTISSISIIFAKFINQNVMKMILGIFLIVLAIYFLFFNNKTIEPKGMLSITCIIISGMCDGLFGIGGPLMVIYFLTKTSSKEEYLGTIQCFFLVNTVYTTIFRIVNSIITISLLPVIAFGMIGIILGVIVANRIIDKLDGELLKNLTYILIALCGISNVVTTLL